MTFLQFDKDVVCPDTLNFLWLINMSQKSDVFSSMSQDTSHKLRTSCLSVLYFSHAPVRGSSQARTETGTEATKCKTVRSRAWGGIWTMSAASSAGNTSFICRSQHLSHWNHWNLHTSKERKWVFDPVYGSSKLCQLIWQCRA